MTACGTVIQLDVENEYLTVFQHHWRFNYVPIRVSYCWSRKCMTVFQQYNARYWSFNYLFKYHYCYTCILLLYMCILLFQEMTVFQHYSIVIILDYPLSHWWVSFTWYDFVLMLKLYVLLTMCVFQQCGNQN